MPKLSSETWPAGCMAAALSVLTEAPSRRSLGGLIVAPVPVAALLCSRARLCHPWLSGALASARAPGCMPALPWGCSTALRLCMLGHGSCWVDLRGTGLMVVAFGFLSGQEVDGKAHLGRWSLPHGILQVLIHPCT